MHSGLSVVYPDNRVVSLTNGSQTEIKYLQVNDYCIDIRVHCWHGDGNILLSEDVETGDLLIEPSGFSGQAGVRSVKWAVPGIDKSLKLVAPLYQGIKWFFLRTGGARAAQSGKKPFPFFFQMDKFLAQELGFRNLFVEISPFPVHHCLPHLVLNNGNFL